MYFRILSVRPIFDDDFGDAANDRLHLGMASASVGLDRGCDKVAFATCVCMARTQLRTRSTETRQCIKQRWSSSARWHCQSACRQSGVDSNPLISGLITSRSTRAEMMAIFYRRIITAE